MAELTNVPILSGNPARGSMMCMTEHLSWVLGAWSCTPDLKVQSGACHWWPPQVPPSRHPFAPVRMLWSWDWAPVNDIYRCPTMDGWQCLWLGWGVPVHPGLMVLVVSARGSWCNKQPNSHAGKTLFFMINCHLKFQIVCVCVFCFNSSRQSESYICIN